LRYEVMYLLDAEDDKMHAFREVWAGLGDSIVIVGGDGLYNCHIHTDDIGAGHRGALDAGRPREIRVTDLTEQVVEERWVREGTLQPTTSRTRRRRPRWWRSWWARGSGGSFTPSACVLVLGGQSMNPSTRARRGRPARPGLNRSCCCPTTRTSVRSPNRWRDSSSRRVAVVPTNSIVEGFAALLAYDPDASPRRTSRP
jgi:dihydroxyacetone kinase-like predicted kinase